MTWECSECTDREGRKVRVDSVCHHCGKPLCRTCRLFLPDYAFSAFEDGSSVWAYHCRDCQMRFHPWAILAGQHT
jgi:Pyruvate/2-oxoacid:ferredoxin oxidoreductase delta subunit